MSTLSKGLIGSITAGALALGTIAPAQAQWRGDRDRYRQNNGISAGEIIAGALIIGGIAAVATSVGRNGRDRYVDSPRDAVERCVVAAERTASRYSYGGRSDVTDIRNVRQTRYGYRVQGRIAVNQMDHDWRRGDARYGRGWDRDYRGWNNNHRGWDSGRFTCEVQRGGVADLRYSGIRGL